MLDRSTGEIQFRQISDISMLSGALSCLVGNGHRQKSYLKQYVKINLQSYEPGGRTFESCQARQTNKKGHPIGVAFFICLTHLAD